MFNIDYQDPAIAVLEDVLKQFAISAIELNKITEERVIAELFSDECLKQLYVDRVIAFKARNLADLPIVKLAVKEAMGNYQNIFWNNL